MSAGQQAWESVAQLPAASMDEAKWYAVHTRSRHEKMVAQRLREQGLDSYLPLLKQTRRWSDRKKIVEMPLFGCYVFVRMALTGQERLRVCTTDGVLQIVGSRGAGLPIPDEQMDAVRLLLAEQLPCSAHPFLKIGERVRVRGGAMDGVEGILLAHNRDRTLVVSVDVIQRSLAVRIEGYRVEPV